MINSSFDYYDVNCLVISKQISKFAFFVSQISRSGNTMHNQKPLLKSILTIILLTFIVGCSDSGNSPSDETIPNPKKYYKIDVKTSFKQKSDITGAKNGLIAYLKEVGKDWCSVQEIGEDYEVWIKDPLRIKSGNKRTVTITLDLKKSTTFGADLVKTISLSETYNINQDFEGKSGGFNAQNFSDFYTDYKWIINLVPGGSTLTGVVDFLLPFLNANMTDGEDDQQKAEAVIIGAKAYKQLLLWFNEIEAQ